jgi:hypothetical protein
MNYKLEYAITIAFYGNTKKEEINSDSKKSRMGERGERVGEGGRGLK